MPKNTIPPVMNTLALRRLQQQIRGLVDHHYHPSKAADPMDPSFLIWKHGPTLAWAVGRYLEELEAGCSPALLRPVRQGRNEVGKNS
jgi:hypothetical protein